MAPKPTEECFKKRAVVICVKYCRKVVLDEAKIASNDLVLLRSPVTFARVDCLGPKQIEESRNVNR